MPPFGLRSHWPGASLLSRSSIAADTLPPSRLAPGQFERNECIVISETQHLSPCQREKSHLQFQGTNRPPRANALHRECKRSDLCISLRTINSRLNHTY